MVDPIDWEPGSGADAMTMSPDVSQTADFPAWPRSIRLSRPWLVTEKLDGTGAVIAVDRPEDTTRGIPPGAVRVEAADHTRWVVRAGCRGRWLTTARDNFGFAAWVADHAASLITLGPGLHRGEWYGAGIRRGYGLDVRRFALFDAERWTNLPEALPPEIEVVPVLARCDGYALSGAVGEALGRLTESGSVAVPGQAAEGIVVASTACPQVRFKASLADAFDHGPTQRRNRSGPVQSPSARLQRT